MTCGLVHTSYSLPEWQAVKMTFFAPCSASLHYNRSLTLWSAFFTSASLKLLNAYIIVLYYKISFAKFPKLRAPISD